MFFRSRPVTPSTRPAQLYKAKLDNFMKSRMRLLPNGLLLILTGIEDDVKARLFDPVNKRNVAEVKLPNFYHCPIAHALQDKIYVEDMYRDYGLILNANTLETNVAYNAQSTPAASMMVSLEKDKLATITKVSDSSDRLKKTDYYAVITYDPQLKSRQISKLPIPVCKQDKDITPLVNLAENQFAFGIHRENKFDIHLLTQTLESGFKHSGTIELTGDQSANSGNFVALADGRLVTYQRYKNHLQIWEGTRCVDHWRLCNGFAINTVSPLPDCEHLLIGNHFLFNIRTGQIKRVDLGDDVLLHYSQVCQNGQVIIVTRTTSDVDTYLAIVEFQEMFSYRNGVKQELVNKGLCESTSQVTAAYAALNVSSHSASTREEEKIIRNFVF
jgi:hypothetical protein